jgi:Zn-dependent protease
MRERPRDAGVEAKVAIAGPLLGSLGAWAVLGTGLALEQPLLVALGHSAVMVNLFNLVPVPPLDGGRIAGAFTPALWIVGYGAGIAALLVTRSPLLLIALVVGLVTLVRRWRDPVPGYAAISREHRLAIAAAYAALVVALTATLPLGAPR